AVKFINPFNISDVMEKVLKEIALIILETVKEKEGTIGIGKLALLLKGSSSKRIANDSASFKSAIFWYPVDAIENFVKQLVSMGLLQVRAIGFYPDLRPVLYLTVEGKKAVEEKREMLLDIVRKEKEIRLNEPMKVTLEAFARTKSIEKTADETRIAVSTVWKHFIDLVAMGIMCPCDILPEERVNEILKDSEGSSRVGEVKAKHPEYGYNEIRLVLSWRNFEKGQEPSEN
ncbi:MAG: helix-turn-helix domain-containing protein, partial [Nanoarchaeota archaeon]